MKKSEMEDQQRAYYARLDDVRTLETREQYGAALKAAVASLEHVDGMMQYEQKYLDQTFAGIGTIDFILKYAPLLLEARALRTVGDFLKSRKRVDRDATDDIGAEVELAGARLRSNYELWAYLERRPETKQEELPELLVLHHVWTEG